MDTTLDDGDVRSILAHYRTCELATLSRSGAPIAWPTTPLWRPGDGTIVFTTSIGYPQKAHNIRRDPRVGLLFSDPTGSGLEGMPELLVQGEATCTDGVLASPADDERLADWFEHTWTRQPGGRAIGGDPFTRWFMAWFFHRIVISVQPVRVHTRPARRRRRADDGGTRPTPRRGSTSGEAFGRLSGYDSAVLAARDADGAPWLLRVRPELDVATGQLVVDVPGDEPVHEGPASLLAHRHDEKVAGLESVVVVGDIARHAGHWAFAPTRIVPGAGTDPASVARVMLGCRRSAHAYLERRHAPPPSVDWAGFDAVRARVVQRERQVAGSGQSAAR